MNLRVPLFAITATFLAVPHAQAVPMRTGSDRDKTADFSKLKSYVWHPALDAASSGLPPEFFDLGKGVLVTALEKEGVQEIETGKPDLHVFFRVLREKKVESVRMGAMPGDRGQVVERTYEAGTLVVDLMDPDSNRTLWRGWVRAEIYPDLSPEKRKKRFEQAVEKLMKEFPRK